MAQRLQGRNVAILVTDGFEQVELTEPRKALEDAGAKTHVVSVSAGDVKAWKYTDWGETVAVDIALDTANAADYDALVLPGGVMNPDALRRETIVQDFVRAFFDGGKTVAVIYHGPRTLIDAGVVEGRRLTSYHIP